MPPLSPHGVAVAVEFALALVTFVALRLLPAPYGRYARVGWGPTLSARTGWLLMESPAVLFFAGVYAFGRHRAEAAPLVLLCLWQLHYIHRTFVFPLRLLNVSKRMPAAVAGMAIAFNLLNGWINARWISDLGTYPSAWLRDPRFLLGAAAFLFGFFVNVSSDRALLRLRKPGDSGYYIPKGPLFAWVSCPNYLGEIIEWFGWALATWSWAGLAFAVYTVANLAPRALTHHAWYRQKFQDYPKRRKALLPLVL
jgi:protein-S-isoprenylcysteine O-methyltransferase Ste14